MTAAHARNVFRAIAAAHCRVAQFGAGTSLSLAIQIARRRRVFRTCTSRVEMDLRLCQ